MAVDVRAEVVGHRQRLAAGKDGGAGIARLVGAVPEPVIAGQVKFRLLRTHLCLLQADHVRVGKGAEIQKALAQTGAQAVDIP